MRDSRMCVRLSALLSVGCWRQLWIASTVVVCCSALALRPNPFHLPFAFGVVLMDQLYLMVYLLPIYGVLHAPRPSRNLVLRWPRLPDQPPRKKLASPMIHHPSSSRLEPPSQWGTHSLSHSLSRLFPGLTGGSGGGSPDSRSRDLGVAAANPVGSSGPSVVTTTGPGATTLSPRTAKQQHHLAQSSKALPYAKQQRHAGDRSKLQETYLLGDDDQKGRRPHTGPGSPRAVTGLPKAPVEGSSVGSAATTIGPRDGFLWTGQDLTQLLYQLIPFLQNCVQCIYQFPALPLPARGRHPQQQQQQQSLAASAAYAVRHALRPLWMLQLLLSWPLELNDLAVLLEGIPCIWPPLPSTATSVPTTPSWPIIWRPLALPTRLWPWTDPEGTRSSLQNLCIEVLDQVRSAFGRRFGVSWLYILGILQLAPAFCEPSLVERILLQALLKGILHEHLVPLLAAVSPLVCSVSACHPGHSEPWLTAHLVSEDPFSPEPKQGRAGADQKRSSVDDSKLPKFPLSASTPRSTSLIPGIQALFHTILVVAAHPSPVYGSPFGPPTSVSGHYAGS